MWALFSTFNAFSFLNQKEDAYGKLVCEISGWRSSKKKKKKKLGGCGEYEILKLSEIWWKVVKQNGAYIV